MICYTICLNKDGECSVTKGIGFERTDDSSDGLLRAGGREFRVEFDEDFKDERIYNAFYSQDAVVLVDRVAEVSVDAKTESVDAEKESNVAYIIPSSVFFLAFPRDDSEDAPRAIIHITAEGRIDGELRQKEIQDLSIYTNDSDTYGYISLRGDSYLLCVERRFFNETFALGAYNFKVSFQKDEPHIEVTKI